MIIAGYIIHFLSFTIGAVLAVFSFWLINIFRNEIKSDRRLQDTGKRNRKE